MLKPAVRRGAMPASLLPPSLLYRHPGYLRPLHGVRPPGGLHLHIAAFDLARSLGVPVYDVNQTGYPQRMREWNSRQRGKA